MMTLILRKKNREVLKLCVMGLMGERKRRGTGALVQQLRNHRLKEQEIADQSITLLRNHQDLIPVDRKKSLLIVEWEKVTATFPTMESKRISMLEEVAGRYFSQVEVSVFGFEDTLTKSFIRKFADSHYVMAALYSRNSNIAQMHMNILKQLMATRGDTIVVSLGNPFDIKWMPEIKNYLVSYGFRYIQLEALFRVLTGEVTPRGRLPVDIDGYFSRGDGITC